MKKNKMDNPSCEEKQRIYADRSGRGIASRPGLTPSHIASLRSILSTLSSVKAQLFTIGKEALNADISVAAETIGDAMGYIDDCVNLAENKILYEDAVEVDEADIPF